VTGAAATMNVMAPHKQRPVANGLADISHPT
jgi:ornithine carbamoyltransferase